MKNEGEEEEITMHQTNPSSTGTVMNFFRFTSASSLSVIEWAAGVGSHREEKQQWSGKCHSGIFTVPRAGQVFEYDVTQT